MASIGADKTLTLPSGPAGPGLSRFMAASLMIHAVFALIVVALGREFISGDARPGVDAVAVEVVELPPGYAPASPTTAPPKVPKRYADRTSVVDKETYPVGRTGAYAPGRSWAGTKGGKGGPSKAGKAMAAPPGAVTDVKRAEAPAARAEAAKTVTTPGEGMAQAPPAKPRTGEGRPSSSARVEPGASPATTARPGRPNLLLPEERIAELTREYEASAPKNEAGKTLQLNTSELRYQKYVIGIKNRIEDRWEYPEAAARNGWAGALQIEFTIMNDGALADVKLVKSSGYPALDDAAVTALKLAAPFQPFPADFGIERINIKGQFEYVLIYRQSR